MSITINSLIQSIRFARIRFTLEAGEATRLPGYKGSTLRGALGDTMRRMVCRMPMIQDCTTCRYFQQCAYASFHENALPAEHPLRKLFPRLPQPYVIEPADQFERDYLPGDTLPFDLLLFGTAIDQYPLVVQSLMELRNTGLGRDHVPFILKEVADVLPDGSIHPLSWGDNPRVLDLSSLSPAMEAEAVTLDFRTPVYLKTRDGEARPGSPELFRSLITRVSWLAALYCGHPMSGDFPIRQLPSMPELIEDLTERVQWNRYSGRQDTSMRFGGYIGRVSFRAITSEVADLLRIGREVHVGGQVTFGQGRYHLL